MQEMAQTCEHVDFLLQIRLGKQYDIRGCPSRTNSTARTAPSRSQKKPFFFLVTFFFAGFSTLATFTSTSTAFADSFLA